MPTLREADLLAIALFTFEAGALPAPCVLRIPTWRERQKAAFMALAALEIPRYREQAEALLDHVARGGD